MRRVGSVLVIVVFAAFVCGCSSGGSGPTTDDQAFERKLEEAAAKSKGEAGKHTMKHNTADPTIKGEAGTSKPASSDTGK
jgi:hypothetical protein